MKLARITIDDETVEYVLIDRNKRHDISHVDHDMHGWSGMEAVDDALTTLAKYAGIEVIDEEPEE